ncbi:hypothetical protein Unana1_01958 [Umbelopsis nana]
MQYSDSRPSSPLAGDQFGWPKPPENQNQFAWNLSFDESQVRVDYLSPDNSGGEEHHPCSSYSTDSTFSFHTDTGITALDSAYKTSNLNNMKTEDLCPIPISLNEDFNSPPRKRSRPDYNDYNGTKAFNLAPSITIPSSPSNRLIKSPLSPPQEVYSNSVSPKGSPSPVSYSMLVQDALSCFQPKQSVDHFEADNQGEPEPFNRINRIAHNAIERRYRNNINDCLNDLKNAVPALKFAKAKDNNIDDTRPIDPGMEQEEELIDGVPVATKLNKATILRKATEYITHLKVTLEQCESENKALQNLILQLPRGQEVVSYYRMQKEQFETYERERMAMERQTDFERRQREKREARRKSKLLRRGQLDHTAYSRRQSSSSSSSSTGQTFMVLFLGMTFFSNTNYLKSAHNISDAISHEGTSNSILYTIQSLDFWHIIKSFLILVVIISIVRAILSDNARIRKCKNCDNQPRQPVCDCE